MANLKEIRERKVSVASTRQITSAMKMVSAAKLKKAQDAIVQFRPYANKLKEILASVGDSMKDDEDNLYFVVSGTLKDSYYPSLDEKMRIHRPSDLYLSENQFFGDIYPFNENRKCESDIKTTTQVELVKLSKPKLIQLCNKFRNIEFGILELFKVRQNSEEKGIPKFLRKAKRYHVPIDMNLEMYPQASENSTVIIDGFSSDISVGGICLILDSNDAKIASIIEAFEKKTNSEKIWIGLSTETMHIKVLGHIAWNHAIILNGKKTLVLGVQFEEMSPRLRGMLFMFANSLQR